MSRSSRDDHNYMSKSSSKILPDEYISYPKRWLVLLSVVIVNIAGAMIWLTFTPVAYKASQYYSTSLDTINWLSVVFMVAAIPAGALATWVLEAYGLRFALHISAWLCCVGSGIRIASVAGGLSADASLALLFVGQCLTAVGQPFSMYAPAKTASTWFPDHQRTIATTIGAVANPVGVVIAGLISPLFVHNGNLDAFNLLITMFAPAAFAALVTTICVTSAEPPSPPSAGGVGKPGVFGEGLKDIIKKKNYMILVWTIGGGIGLYSTFATLLEQLLCPWGYTDTMAGICSASLTAAGVVGAAVIGVYCDYSKQFSSTVKICYIVTALGIVTFSIVFHINMDYYILILIIGVGLFSFGIYPIGVELGAECTYPVGVATSSGLIMISGQLQSIILVLVLQSIGRPMTTQEAIDSDSKCYDFLLEDSQVVEATTASRGLRAFAETTEGNVGDPLITYDLSISMYVCAGYMGLLALVLLIFFRPKYLRMTAEQGGEDLERSNSDSSIHKDIPDDLTQF